MSMAGPSCSTASAYRGIVRVCCNHIHKKEFFDDAAVGIPCADGFLRIDEGGGAQMVEYTPELRQTVKLDMAGAGAVLADNDSRRKLDAYDQLVELSKGGPGRFLGHVEVSLGKNKFEDNVFRQQVENVQRAMGGALGGVLYKNQQVILFFGRGRNGKTVFLSIFERLFPSNALTHVPMTAWGSDKNVLLLRNKAVNIMPELNKVDVVPDGQFKTIVPGDTAIIGKALYVDKFTFTPRCAHFGGINGYPNTKDKTEGFFRRIHIVEFPHRFVQGKDEVKDYGDVVWKADKDVVLQWCVEGARKFVAAGYRLVDSERSDWHVGRWRREADNVRSFVEEFDWSSVVLPDPVKGTVLYDYYRDFYKKGGDRIVGKEKFYDELEGTRFKRESSHPVKFTLRLALEDLL